MDIKGRLIIVTSIFTCFLIQAQGADKYTDGNRPYEFGFSIDGEQHRHEKKDEKGLIEGEFGFITADGVYHVTVYATDEQGRFKILSMKNIRVKPYPTYTAKQSSTPARQGHSLEIPASVQTSISSAVTTTTFKPIKIEPPARSCSHCSVPTTSTPAPAFIPPISNNPNEINVAGTPKFPLGVKPQLGSTTSVGQPNGASSPFPQPGRQSNGANNPFAAQPGVALVTPQQTNIPNYSKPPQILNRSQFPSEQGLVPQQISQSFPQQGFRPGQSSSSNPNDPQGRLPGSGFNNPLQLSGIPTLPQQQPQTPNTSPVSLQNNDRGGIIGQNFANSNNGLQGPSSAQYPGVDNIASGRTPKRLDGAPSIGPVGSQPNSLQRGLQNSQSTHALPTKPTLISAQMQIVDKNTDIYRRGPGENAGLPKGLTEDDMTHLLYTFNYTVGFHGHFEEGYTNGFKQGYYYITGRNGVRTRVDYVADSKGFRPKISQEVLDLLSDDVPKPDTEKEEKYGLKGYEFKWLYYPVEAKGL